MAMGKRRIISAYYVRELLKQQSAEAWLFFLRITHTNLADPICVVSDAVDYEYNGDTYIGFLFEIELLSDGARTPETRLRVQNVDQKIGNTVRQLVGAPKLTISLIAASDFDQTVTPRTPITVPEPLWEARNLYLRDVKGDALELEGRITAKNYDQEPWPSRRATKRRCPGAWKQ